MTTLHIDFETRSTLDLTEVGIYNYSRHPSTEPWCMAYAFDDEDVLLWRPDSCDMERIRYHIATNGDVVAHNAPFELAIWNNIMAPRYGWPLLSPNQTYCTMAQCYAMGLPGALEYAARAVGIAMRKDTEGHALMLRMSRPRSKRGQLPVVWWDEPEKLTRLYEYCMQDVRVERELDQRLLPLSGPERRVWLMDYAINQRGVAVDIETAKAAVAMAEEIKRMCDAELAEITKGEVTSVTALAAMKGWLKDKGVEMDSLAKQAVVDKLAEDLPLEVEAALTLRQESGKASTAKFGRMINAAGEDGRLRNMYQYHGAGTGRWAGRAVQTHNLPRDMPKPEVVEKILALVRAGEVRAIDMLFGAPMTALSRCLRSFFVAPEGKVLIGGDFANVEGRGQAWFAGEQWKLDAFRAADNKTGPGIYELTYAKSFGVPVESVKNPSEERQIGKVMELAFGYQGGVGSFHVMAKTYGVKVSDIKANEFKEAWRLAHPSIKRVWYSIQKAAIAAVKNPGQPFACGHRGRQATFKMVGSFLWCQLPSKRVICYPFPKILEGEYGPQLTYMTQPSEEDRRKGKIITDRDNTAHWARIGTYGGSLFNNIVQGFCRDLMVHAMQQLPDVVLHTHDEVVREVLGSTAKDQHDLTERILRSPPEWAADFPLYAQCSVMTRYGK